jgi:hypothetical protein
MNRHLDEQTFYEGTHQQENERALSSSHDDEEDTEEDKQGGTRSIYLGNIAAACQAVNADCKQPFRSEPARREERRLANRRSAKMSRDRKKMERDQLQEKATRLSQMNLALAQENEDLRKQVNILLQQQNQHDNPHLTEDTQQVHIMLQTQTQSADEVFRQNLMMKSINAGPSLLVPNDLQVQREKLLTQLMLREQEEKQNYFLGQQSMGGLLQHNNIIIGGLPGLGRQQLGASDGQGTVPTMSRDSLTDAGFDNFGFDAFSSQDGNKRQRRGSDFL